MLEPALISKQAVLQARVREVVSAAGVEVAGHGLSAAIAVAMLSRQLDSVVLALWLIGMAGILLYRVHLTWAQPATHPADARRWWQAYSMNIALSGGGWGILLMLAAHLLPAAVVPFAIMLAAFIVASPSLTYYNNHPLFLRFALPALLPCCLVLLLSLELASVITAVLTLAWVAVNHINIRKFSEQADRLAVLVLQKEALDPDAASRPLAHTFPRPEAAYSSDLEADPISREIQAQRTRMMLSVGVVDVVGNLLCIAMVVVLYWGSLGPALLLLWSGVTASGLLLRACYLRNCARISIRRCYSLFEWSSLFNGVCWGTILVLAAQQLPVDQLSYLLFTISGLLVTPSFSYYSFNRIFTCFALPTIVPFAAFLVVQFQLLEIAIAALVLSWLAVMSNNLAKLSANGWWLAQLDKELLSLSHRA